VVLPLILIGSAALAAFVFVRFSSLRITSAGVEIRNFPQAPKVIPLEQADRFVTTEVTGIFARLRPATAALVLTDGSRLPVRVLGESSGAYGVEALNHRLAAMRPGT
jgi:hypothetical protein